MQILILNVPHPSIGSSISDHLPPLGLLSIAGPLIDAGYSVNLIDGEIGSRCERDLLESAEAAAPDIVLLGHCGSTSAHPIIARVARSLRLRLPQVVIIYGGVYLGCRNSALITSQFPAFWIFLLIKKSLASLSYRIRNIVFFPCF